MTVVDAAGSPDPLSDCVVVPCCWTPSKPDASVKVTLLLPCPVTIALGPLAARGLAGAASTGSPVTTFVHGVLEL